MFFPLFIPFWLSQLNQNRVSPHTSRRRVGEGGGGGGGLAALRAVTRFLGAARHR